MEFLTEFSAVRIQQSEFSVSLSVQCSPTDHGITDRRDMRKPRIGNISNTIQFPSLTVILMHAKLQFSLSHIGMTHTTQVI